MPMERGHIVLMGAFAVVTAAEIAGGAGRNLLGHDANLFDLVARFLRAAHKFVAQQIGIAALARAAGQNQNFFLMVFSSPFEFL